MKFNQHIHKARTPIHTINLAGGGGIGLSALVEVYGNTKSGKSSFTYQTAEYFLQDYSSAQIVILDAEGSINSIRLKVAFGLDVENDPRIAVEPGFTIEMCNDAILKWQKKCDADNKFLMIIWDSIKTSSFNKAKNAIDASLEKGEEADRGMTEPMARAQVMTWCLNNALHAIYRKPTIIFLINQITTRVNQFQTTQDSSGGFALRHNVNERYQFTFRKSVGGDAKDALFKTGTMSDVNVIKSRTIPGFIDIPILIDDTIGGRIVSNNELPIIATKLKIIDVKSGGWYSISEDYVTSDETQKSHNKFRSVVTLFLSFSPLLF